MSDKNDVDVETKTHEAEGSWLSGWPAMLLSVAIVGAAIYSFSPRPKPDYPKTEVHVQDLLVTDLAQRGSRIVAVGEQGTILYADEATGPWSQADVDQDRGSNLTRVLFVDDNTVVAVGHDSWILRSTDRGESWREVLFNPERAEPLLGIAGPFDGELLAYGAFGQIQVSHDAGETWTRSELVKEQSEDSAEQDNAASSDPFSDNYDPFAAFGDGGGGFDDFSTRHLNAIIQSEDGALWLAGERGLVARSNNLGASWTQFEIDYNGSFYGLLETAEGRMIVHGMRGNVFYSDDQGENWTRSQSNTRESLYGGVRKANGEILLAGGSNSVIKSSDAGKTFTRVTPKKAKALTAVLVIAPGQWLTAGEAGVLLQGPNAVAAK
ncbi:glycosyl hydrolase [Oceanococcus atlanticus]|uniref:Glycosyl hydrolase n=1 Tax=Oceanococcus atlanticus TaxID=1317117 RepID=A0A1Y1SFV0_9GAMM|nr:hypothetical protein [Oceanococcus atlanticus]ORE88542.1 glycosyl hydrolase [Oceanococcus atlanticus]